MVRAPNAWNSYAKMHAFGRVIMTPDGPYMDPTWTPDGPYIDSHSPLWPRSRNAWFPYGFWYMPNPLPPPDLLPPALILKTGWRPNFVYTEVVLIFAYILK